MITLKFIIITVLVIGILIAVLYFRNKPVVYPSYYKEVWIYYKYPHNDTTYIVKAWLSVNDKLDYIWTLSEDNTTIIPDKYVIKWESIC